ncbi:MAG: helix-turn-helix domain-containing protein [Oscillospiraceae bacterium]|nr:helix-turn-helix domain-containing protein [Oscillospiraceae bacterium]
MKITFEMLVFALGDRLSAQGYGCVSTLHGEGLEASPQEILHIKKFTRDMTLHCDTLYLLEAEQLPLLSMCRRDDAVHILAPSSCGGDLSRRLSKDDCAALFPSEISPEEIYQTLQEIMQQLLRWSAEFSEGILRQRDAEALFAHGSDFLRRDYAIIDIDMNVVYCTSGFASSMSVTERRIPKELFEDLIARKEFHEAASETGVFYYHMAQADVDTVCHNIFVNGQYIARLVMLLKRGEGRLPAGAEDIFNAFALSIQDIYCHMNLLPLRQSRDQLRRLCRALLSGEEPDGTSMEQILRSCGWSEGHRFTCTVLRFSVGSGWDAQLLTVLPYLASSLESLWHNSCAVPVNEEIFLILDHGSEYDPSDRQSFFSALAYFVRDNICKAGISPEFTRFSQLHAAGRAALAALEIGSVHRPDLWYYLFDDYRLLYCIAMLQRSLPPSMLCHPALKALAEHDRTHGTDLVKTLKTYLMCNLNLTAASQKLYIHRTSFCRRMEQIRKLTGLDLHEPDTVFMLQLSCRILGERDNTNLKVF